MKNKILLLTLIAALGTTSQAFCMSPYPNNNSISEDNKAFEGINGLCTGLPPAAKDFNQQRSGPKKTDDQNNPIVTDVSSKPGKENLNLTQLKENSFNFLKAHSDLVLEWIVDHPKTSLGVLSFGLGTDLCVRNKKLLKAIFIYLNPRSDKESRDKAKSEISKTWNSGKMGKATCIECGLFACTSIITISKCTLDTWFSLKRNKVKAPASTGSEDNTQTE